MDRVIVTNNERVKELYGNKAEVIFMEGSSALDIVKESKAVAKSGGRLLFDPTRSKGYYRSLAFYKADNGSPDDKTLSMIDKTIDALAGENQSGGDSILSGIYQRKDLNVIKKLLG